MNVFKRLWAEFIGTFTLVFCGTGAMTVQEVTGGSVTHVGIGLTFGLVVMALVYAFGSVSGAHLNPAVTLGFWAMRLFPAADVVPYTVSQLLGALVASGFLRLLFPTSGTLGATLPTGSDVQSFVLEMVLTFILMLVILMVSQGPPPAVQLAGVAIGGVVMLEALFAGPICGASMNPARSLGPALASGRTESLWVYLVAPPVGATLAVLAVQPFFLHLKKYMP